MKRVIWVLVAGCAAEPANICGDAPYADVELSVDAGAVDVRFSGCPVMRTDDSGHLHAWIANGPHSIRLGGDSIYAPTIHAERVLADGPLALSVVSWQVASQTPGYCVDDGNIEVHLAGTDACTPDGATVAIAGHPELAPTYLDASTAMFGRLVLSDPLAVTASKPGCAALTLGLLPTEPGAISTTVVTLVPR